MPHAPAQPAPHPRQHTVDPGHTVLAIPVPLLDDYVRARTAHYDAAYLAADPQFGQAHITLLAPWVRIPTPAQLAQLEDILADRATVHYQLTSVATFPNGIIHTPVEPAEPFRALTHAIWDRFPAHPPYQGQFTDPVPHVTLDAVGVDIDEVRVRDMLTGQLPVHGALRSCSCSGGRLVTATCNTVGR